MGESLADEQGYNRLHGTGRPWYAQAILDALNPRLSKYAHGLILALIILGMQAIVFLSVTGIVMKISTRIEYKTLDSEVAILEVTDDKKICLAFSKALCKHWPDGCALNGTCRVGGIQSCSEYQCMGLTPGRNGDPWPDMCKNQECEGNTLVAYAIKKSRLDAATLAFAVLGPSEVILTFMVLGIYFCVTRGHRALCDKEALLQEIIPVGLEAAPRIEMEALRRNE